MNLLQNEIEFKKVTSNENLDRFCDLIRLCFNINVSSDYFEWKYFKNPIGNVIAYEAIHNNKTIAFYGVIPELYSINGKDQIVFQSMDTMTHPNYQKKGLFIKLAQLTYDDILKTNHHYYLIGFPGGESYHGFEKKLLWKTISMGSYLFTHKRIFTTLNLIQKKYPITFIELNYNDEKIKNYFNNQNKNRNSIFRKISPEIINWKIINNPIRKYKVIGINDNNSLIGMVIYTLDAKNTCQITWLDFLHSKNYFDYFSSVISYLFKMTNKRYVYSWTPTDPVLLKAYKKSGFLKNPFKRGPFAETFPLITKHAGNNPAHVNWEALENFDFQPIMLD